MFNGQQQTLTINGLGRLSDADEFRNIVVRSGEQGQLVRLADVANIELGARSYSSSAQLNGVDSAYMGFTRRQPPMPYRSQTWCVAN